MFLAPLIEPLNFKPLDLRLTEAFQQHIFWKKISNEYRDFVSQS